jgi:membrane-bound lytic murein transglycosylase D
MKNINFRIYAAIFGSFLFLNSGAFSQEKGSTNSSQLDVVLPNYQYEFVPDFTYEEVNERIQKMDLEMEFELNEEVFSYILS